MAVVGDFDYQFNLFYKYCFIGILDISIVSGQSLPRKINPENALRTVS